MTTHTLRDEALSFACQGERLVGVISLPAAVPATPGAPDLALLVVVGGPQVRTGSHRQFTQLCRAAAAAGVPALRFDVRGMGDSSGALRSFEQLDDDIDAALAALQTRCPHVKRVVLWGLCDGASAILLHAQRRADTRVAGAVLLNPWVRSTQTLAQAHLKHYYRDRLRQREFWLKLLSGRVAMKALRDLTANVRAARSTGAGAREAGPDMPFQQRMLLGAEGLARPTLWVLSGRDHTAREFEALVGQQPRWQQVLAAARAQRLALEDADHTFSDTAAMARLAEATVAWLQQLQTRPLQTGLAQTGPR